MPVEKICTSTRGRDSAGGAGSQISTVTPHLCGEPTVGGATKLFGTIVRRVVLVAIARPDHGECACKPREHEGDYDRR